MNLFLSIFLQLLILFFYQEKADILIIGDSISIGYIPFVKESLAEKANVVHNPGNAQHTFTGLESLEKWIGETQWDIIQFNWGLWDLCYRKPGSMTRDKVNGRIAIPIKQYRKNLQLLVQALKKTDAKLVFVTTSYVPEGEPGRYVEDVLKYNKAAQKIMQKEGVVVNDIYRQSMKIHRKYARGPNDVHYSSEGYQELSLSIVNELKKLL